MPDVLVDLYTEDAAQEAFLTALTKRVLDEARLDARIRAMSVRGGHGRVRTAIISRQRSVSRRRPHPGVPDLLVVGRDADGTAPAVRRREMMAWIDGTMFPRVALAVPTPYIERWFLLDEAAFARVAGLGAPAITDSTKFAYKYGLEAAVDAAGVPTLLPGGYDLAPDIVSELSLYKCGKLDSGFRYFVNDLGALT